MELHINRDSVAAGDDADPHNKILEFVGDPSLKEAVKRIASSGYLPQMHDRKVCWVVSSDRPIAMIAEHWHEPKFLRGFNSDDKLSGLARNEIMKWHFSYLIQHDPDVVYEILSRVRYPGN
jgi:dsRNA-specific ribonuclease